MKIEDEHTSSEAHFEEPPLGVPEPYKRLKVEQNVLENSMPLTTKIEETEKKREKKKQTKVSKKAMLVQGAASAVLAVSGGIGLMAATGIHGNQQSTSLMQIPEESFIQDFDFVGNKELEILPPCEVNQHHFSLDDTYLTYDVRDSYITR